MKTTLDWLKEIPDAEVREKAIANYDPKFAPHEIPYSISEAIEYGFSWEKAKEDASYWLEQNRKYFNYNPTEKSLTEELQQELDRHNKAILEILKKHGK